MPIDFAIFQDHGYRGLYRMSSKEIQAHKKLKRHQKILDHMGSTELAANLFRATQTEEKLKRGSGVRFKAKANEVHFEVGAKVRNTIWELGGPMPEELPTHDNIKKVERKKRKFIEYNK